MNRILIMEDNVLLANEWLETLERNGCSVRLTSSGEDAALALQKERFDLVVTDLFVAGEKGGLWVLMAARKLGRQAPPVIVVTGITLDTLRGSEGNLFLKQAIALGAAKVLEKPFPAGELVVQVQALLD